MSKIDRMQIQGIRSFGPQQGETIVFNTPLTLIVGWNGSGKTTIIECLKYATTGELPPNSKTGGAFIHDPRLLAESETMAQVKLSFRSTSGVPMVVSRKMQLIVRKNTRSQKTLEGSLLMRRDGHKESVSSRVAELDQIVPQFLGVSKSVLENVIFCHQEDSLWPMSEPAALKKKFDSIFEADKYTKAIDNIKVIRKNQVNDLAVARANEKNAQENQARAKESQKRLMKLDDEIESHRSDHEKAESGAREAREKSRNAYEHAAKYEQIVAQLQGKRVTYTANEENVTSLEDNLKMMAETDDELKDMMEQYGERVQQYQDQQEDFKTQYRSLQAALQHNRTNLGIKQSEVGKHQAEKDQHARNLQKRENLIKETAKRHDIRDFDHDVDDTKVAEFQQILRKLAREQNKALDRARTDAQEELGQAQATVNHLSEQKAGLSQRKDLSKSQIATSDKRITELQNVLSKIRVDEGAEAVILNKKKATEKELEKASADTDNADHDRRIQDVENTLHALEDRKERLDTELVQATQLASESAEVDYTQNKLVETKHSLETMKSVHSARISQLVDPDWDVASLGNVFRDVLAQKNSDLKDAEAKRDISQDKLNQISFRLSSIESEQKKKRAEYTKYKNTVLDAIQRSDIDDFEETLFEVEADFDTLSKDTASFGAQLEYLQSCLEVAEKHDQCRLCRRTLKDDKAEGFTKAGFMSQLKNMVAKATQNAEANIEEVQAELEKMRGAKPSYDLAKRAEEVELPALKAEHEKLVSERNGVNKQLEEHDNIIYELNQAKQEIESLSVDVQSIVSSYDEARELEDRVVALKKKQKTGGLSRGISAVREDLQKVTDKSRTAKAELAALSSERDNLRKIVGTLELRIRDINAELSAAQSSLKEKRNLVERIDEFKTGNAEQREAIREFDTEMQALEPELERAQATYKDVNRRGNEKVNRVQEEASKLSDSVRQLSEADQDISAYIDKGGPQRLARAQQEIENLEIEIKQIEDDMSNVARDIKKTEETLSGVEHTKQSIFDNLRYRKAKRTLETLAKEIEDLEQRNAEHDQAHWTAEGDKWDAEYQLLHVRVIELSTTMKQLDIQMVELSEEYEKYYKNAAQEYREAHIKVETIKAACDDLGRYGSALEQAILKFHTIKMDEINKIIDELWRNAYQGTDVDTVRIRSDNEGGARNRTYNYRVVMVKRDNEMDMRGRCSAGQKVLASIVIRLALAECFGTNCGLIALDEPTTNLDQQNIKGLAESLSQIIQIRRKQANFQLLVITHDEQFLREMNCGDYTDVYWRVGRDKDQQSYIERQNIAEVNALLPPFMLTISRTELRNRAVFPDYLPA
ncbi:DNA repair protein rad50 [Didymosphaeria variabile]|uniref:DNA repair protein RAD50 n=1 Tax=Didymosphaeria variabile TaxID=1932322 RepID=A0A9W8XQG7_9PLEO|nr:DNA repair protein rad50 [Didymosphaeria variabile]KAJ4357220.1 DNA repair protein rad50 [Didymosphaeria variabile]